MFRALLPGVQSARYGLVAALFTAGPLAGADWIALRGAGVELYSDTSEKAARQVLERLAEIQAILPVPESESAVPMRMVLFAKQGDYLKYAPEKQSAGFYASGTERDYIALFAGAGLPRVVAHEYVHFAAHQRDVMRPAWLEEGLAEFYSNFNGRELGTPIPEHLKLLERPWLSAEEMNHPTTLGVLFYAQSWALVHMLRREARFPEQVTPSMLDELRVYLRTVRGVKANKPRAVAPATLVQPVSPLNALLLRAELALHARKPALAESLYTRASREFPNSSAAAVGLGALAHVAGDRAGARAHLRRALELNDRNALAWLQWGLSENDTNALERAAEINPNLAEAHILLGVRATDDGDLLRALDHLGVAVRLLPRKSNAWYSLGYAQHKSGDFLSARGSLEQALATASSPEQRAMAAALLDSLAPN